MNTVLYLIGKAHKDTLCCDFFSTIEIMNENDLRQFFKNELDAGNISQQNLDDHNFIGQDDLYETDISEIFSILCDNDEYDEAHTYYISQREVCVDDQDIYD